MKNLRARLMNGLRMATGYRVSHAEAEAIADQQAAFLTTAEAEAREQAEQGHSDQEQATATAEAHAIERERLSAILRSREASANWDEALRLSLDTSLPAPEAVRVLRGLRAATTTLPSLAYAGGHDLGPDAENMPSEEIDHATAASVLNLYAGARQRIQH